MRICFALKEKKTYLQVISVPNLRVIFKYNQMHVNLEVESLKTRVCIEFAPGNKH